MKLMNPHAPDNFSRSSILEFRVERLHEARSLAQAHIELIEIKGQRYVFKDFGQRSWLVRALFGRHILARELRAYRPLQGLEGIPRIIRIVDADGFLMQRLDAERLPHRRDNFLEPVFFDRLEKLLSEMHARDVAHGDLRRKNIFCTRDQHPYLLDFATAHVLLPTSNPVRRYLFRRCVEVDRLTFLKLKCDYCPAAMTADERAELAHPPTYLTVGRFLKQHVYRKFLKPRRWRKRVRRWLS